jgi:outer membrane receptor for ferrienterochelin and colicins
MHTQKKRFGKSYLASAIAVVSLTALTVNAQETKKTLDKVVVSAAGFEQKITDAPASISVVTAEELAKKPYMTLLDAVRELEGVDIGESSDKSGQGSVSMRGMGGKYTLLMINGKRQNNHGDIYPNDFGGNQFGHMPPLDAIERIEVIRGPASTLYGADAMGGVINVITKKVTDTWTGSLTATRTMQSKDEFGDDITNEFNVMGPLIPGKLGLALRGSWYNRDASNPEYAPVTDPAGDVHQRTLGFGGGGKTVDNLNQSYGVSLSFIPADNQDLVLDYDSSKQEYDNRGNQLGTEDTLGAMLRLGGSGSNAAAIIQPRAGYAADQEFTREQVSLQHNGEWSFGKSQVSLQHIKTNNDGRTLPYTVEERGEIQALWNQVCEARGGSVNADGFCPVTEMGYRNVNAWNNLSEDEKLAVIKADLTDAEYAQLEGYLPRPQRKMESRQTTLTGKLELPIGDHLAIVGGEVIRGDLEDGVFGMYGGGYRSGVTQEHNMWSLFAEDNWQVTDAITLTTGIRYDDHEIFGDNVSPRIYGVYHFQPGWTVKGGVSTGYKTPETSDLYAGIKGFGGQGVSPSVGNPNLKPEKSVSTEIALYWEGELGHNFNVTVFHNQFDDKISGGGDLVKSCEVASPGEYCTDLGEGWANLGYSTFSQTQNIDKVDINGAEVAGRYQFTDTLSLRGNYTWTDSEQKSGVNKGRPLNKTAEHMANITLDWDVFEKLNLFLTAEVRSDRYEGWDAEAEEELFYKSYNVLHLGASFKASDTVTFNARINNLLDEDFTAYSTTFIEDNGVYTPSYRDRYNNKDKARNFWVGVNVRF